jgi:hypothetical protein
MMRAQDSPTRIIFRTACPLKRQFFFTSGMKNLARRIKQELKIQTSERQHCAIYEDQLQRIWPLTERNRESKIAQFAKQFGFHLAFYKQGLCAIFEKRNRRARRSF